MRINKFLATVCVVSILLGYSGAARADTAGGDGDTAAPSRNVAATCTAETDSGAITLTYTGGSHYTAGEPLTITKTVTPQTAGNTFAGITSAPTSATNNVASAWASNGVETTIGITTTVPANSVGDTYKVEYTIVGNSSGKSLDAHFNVIVSCTPTPGNAAPVVEAGGPYSGDEGGSGIALNGGSFTDADGPSSPAATAAWSIDSTSVSPGTCSLSNASSLTGATITCTDNGTATVNLTVTDGLGAAGSDTAGVTINNANPSVGTPTVTASSPCSASVSAAFTDAGSADTHTGTIDWGDSSPVAAATITESSGSGTAASPADHTYTTAGIKTVTVTVTDDDSGSGSNTGTFTTKNTASNFLAPINTSAGQRSVFKLGSTIPVKITVVDCAGDVVSTLTPVVQLQKVDSVPDGSVNETQINETPTNGKNMRWDGTQYLYNLSTKNSQFNGGTALQTGTYRLWVTDPSFFASPLVYFDLK